MNKPKVLLSNFFGNTSFPHFLRKKESAASFSADVVFDPIHPIKLGDEVSLATPVKNTRIFKITKVEEVRKAKGDWSAYEVQPLFCKIEASFLKYWDEAKNDN